MSEEQEKQESQKTVVAFIAGLLIGGLLVWIFSGSPQEQDPEMDNGEGDTTTKVEEKDTESNSNQEKPTDTQRTTSNTNTAPVTADTAMSIGDADVTVNNQTAGTQVDLAAVTFPTDEGWIGVREYTDGQLGYLLGVVRYSKEQNLVPEQVVLQRATTRGKEYAVVFYSENGDRTFSLANDAQLDGIADTFTAQ